MDTVSLHCYLTIHCNIYKSLKKKEHTIIQTVLNFHLYSKVFLGCTENFAFRYIVILASRYYNKLILSYFKGIYIFLNVIHYFLFATVTFYSVYICLLNYLFLKQIFSNCIICFERYFLLTF